MSFGKVHTDLFGVDQKLQGSDNTSIIFESLTLVVGYVTIYVYCSSFTFSPTCATNILKHSERTVGHNKIIFSV